VPLSEVEKEGVQTSTVQNKTLLEVEQPPPLSAELPQAPLHFGSSTSSDSTDDASAATIYATISSADPFVDPNIDSRQLSSPLSIPAIHPNLLSPDGLKNCGPQPLFIAEQLGIDRRLIVNRKRQLKMYRVWMQGRFRKL